MCRELGNGRSGTVYLAYHVELEEYRAVKVVPKSLADYDTFRKSWTAKVSNGKGLRIWNRTKTRAIRKVPNGKKVEVMFVKGKYAKVRYRGTVGYMKSAYLK